MKRDEMRFVVISVMYVDQKPEWKMEKMRYYCELPGDIWEDGTFLKCDRISTRPFAVLSQGRLG